jgi:DNA-directed RNA polymerase subunit omega
MMDMLALLPENSKDRYDSRHRLVIAASQRAKQIMQGSRLTIQTKFTKETTMAIDEMVQGKLEYLIGKEARQAMKDAKRMRESEFERVAASATTLGEDAREIKKELSVYVDDSPKMPEVEPDAAPEAGPDTEE